MWVKSRNGTGCGFSKSQPTLPDQLADSATGETWQFFSLHRYISLF